jgi:hypothetical protein
MRLREKTHSTGMGPLLPSLIKTHIQAMEASQFTCNQKV